MEWSSVFFGFMLCLFLQNVALIARKIKSIRIDFNDEKSKEIEGKENKKQIGE